MPKTKTSDIGLLVRDMIEDKEFNQYNLKDEAKIVGQDEVTFVDVSDPNNPVVHTASGSMFVMHIVSLN